MNAELIKGTVLAEDIKSQVRAEVSSLVKKHGEASRPCLALVLVGDDPVSHRLVSMKKRDCESVGMDSFILHLPQDATQQGLMREVERLNADPAVTGVLCQLPLPAQIDEKAVIKSIDEGKDADGFNALIGCTKDDIAACTPAGIIRLIESCGVDIAGKHAVVVGRSSIVGKPLAIQLLLRDATVTVCHRKTVGLAEHTRRADILIAAAGCPGLITADMIKPGAIVIDVGMNYTVNGLVGDVEFDGAAEVASFITPVPGGVGPMTRAMLLYNTLELAKKRLRGV